MEPEYEFQRIVRRLMQQEMARIDVELLNFVYWNDRWPEKMLFYDGQSDPPSSPDENIHWDWIKISDISRRYICFE